MQPGATILENDIKWVRGGNMESEFGLKERLLCQSCEQRFGQYEDYFRKYFYERAKPLRLKKHLGTKISVPSHPISLCCEQLHVDYRRLKLFGLSLLWRCSIAKGKFFGHVNLDATHEYRIAELLRVGAPGPDSEYPIMVFRPAHPTLPARYEGILGQPRLVKDDEGVDYCSLRFGGLDLWVFVPSRSSYSDVFSLKKSGGLILLTVDASVVLGDLASTFKNLRR